MRLHPDHLFFLLIVMIPLRCNPGVQCPVFPVIDSPINIFNIFFAEVFNKLSLSSTDSGVRIVQIFQDKSDRGTILKFVFEFERSSSLEREYAGFQVLFSHSSVSIPFKILKYVHSIEVNDLRTVLDIGNLDLKSNIFCSDLKQKFLSFLSIYSYFPNTSQISRPTGPVGTVKIMFPPLIAPNAFPMPIPQPVKPSTDYNTFLSQNRGNYSQLSQNYQPSEGFIKKETAVYNNYYTQQTAPPIDHTPILQKLNSLEGLIKSRNVTERNNVVVYPYPVQMPAGEDQTNVVYNITQNRLETSTSSTPLSNYSNGNGQSSFTGVMSSSGGNVSNSASLTNGNLNLGSSSGSVIGGNVSGVTSVGSTQTQQYQIRPTEYLYNLQYGGTKVPGTMTGSQIYQNSKPGSMMTGMPTSQKMK